MPWRSNEICLKSSQKRDGPPYFLGISAFTSRDRECLTFSLDQGVDAISQSFVERAEDLAEFDADAFCDALFADWTADPDDE